MSLTLPFLEDIDFTAPGFGEIFDELPLWSAPFGMAMLARVPLRRGMTILDVGAGTGFLTLELAQRCGPDSTVIAVDPWAAAMKRLERKRAHLGLTNVRLAEGDAAEMEVPAGSVDLVVSNLGINNFDNGEAVLRACARALKPRGTLALTTNLVGHMQAFYDTYRDTLFDLDLQEHLPALDRHIQHRATPESLTTMLTAAGFSEVAVTTDTFPMRFADGSCLLRHAFIRLGFVSGWKQIVPAAEQARVFTLLEKKLNDRAKALGDLTLTVPMAYVEARRP